MPETLEFTFEHTLELRPAIYLEINETFERKSRPVRRLAALAIGLACLAFAYTIVLGIIILVVLALAVLVPRLIPDSAARSFAASTHLHGPVKYGVSATHLWAEGDLFVQRCAWDLIAVYEERGDWLRIAPRGLNQLYFSISELKAAGVYDQILSLAEHHAEQYRRSLGVAA
jgi:hypothetical protein